MAVYLGCSALLLEALDMACFHLLVVILLGHGAVGDLDIICLLGVDWARSSKAL